MNVYLTFDIEVWCNDWHRLDERFPASFERYYFGRSRHGEYALPKTLEILNRHRLRGVFFVEPLFAARFGIRYLRTVVDLIEEAGQKVDLHLHPEWTDEISPPPIDDVSKKRRHLTHYSLEEQTKLIGFGKELLREAGVPDITAFRAGNFACNLDTFRALRAAGVPVDSSLNAYYTVSGKDLGEARTTHAPLLVESVQCFPVANYLDGRGRLRSAQLSGASFEELRDAMIGAETLGWTDFVIVSHNFEMLKSQRTDPDFVVVRRFERLCAYLDRHREHLPTLEWSGDVRALAETRWEQPRVGLWASSKRLVEQAMRRL